MESLEGSKIAVVGLGASGRAAARLALERGGDVYATDLATDAETAAVGADLRSLGARVDLGPHRLEKISGATAVVVSPGIPPDAPVLRDLEEHGISWISELEFAFRFFQGPLIAVTGTNGKTTTAALTAHLLRESGLRVGLGGNIGAGLGPAASELALMEPAPDRYVVEASSFQLADVEWFRPDVGVVTNLAPDHLDRYPDTAAYYADKKRLFDNADVGCDWVLNGDDPGVLELARGAAGRHHHFRMSEDVGEGEPEPDAFLDGDQLVIRWFGGGDGTAGDVAGNDPAGIEPAGTEPAGSDPAGSDATGGDPPHRDVTGSDTTGSDSPGGGPTGSGTGVTDAAEPRRRLVLERRDLPLVGRHNVANALAAGLAAGLVGADPEPMKRAFSSFRPLAHRLESVGELDGVLWVNDSKATNVGATVSAVESLDRPIVLLLGGKDKGEDFRRLRGPLASGVRGVVVYGAARERIADALDGAVPTTTIDGPFEEAVEAGRKTARPGDVLLLSPACSSYDMFESYEVRGRRFRELAERARKSAGGAASGSGS